MATRYIALTTQNGQMLGWNVVLVGNAGENRESVEDRASRQICGDQLDGPKDIYVDTELKNLRIVTESTVKRQAALRRALDIYYEQGPEDPDDGSFDVDEYPDHTRDLENDLI